MNKKLLGIMVGLLAMGSLASASTVACPGVSDVVATLGPGLNNCNVSGAATVLFSNFTVSGSAGFDGLWCIRFSLFRVDPERLDSEGHPLCGRHDEPIPE